MKRFSLLLLVAILFAACTNDSIEELQSPIGTENYVPESITVGFEGDGDETRIQLQNGKTVWTKNDQVSVFYLSNANQKWQYYGETGSRTAELKRVDAGSGSTKINKVVVIYPYNEDYYINPESCNIKAFMPAEQTYLEDSYGTNGNIMISAGEYTQFTLKNVCGWLKLQLTGDAEIIKSIKVYGNNGEQVAGEMYIDSTKATATLASDMGGADDEENSAGGNLVFDDTILTEVTLNCGEGVELLPVVTSFYIAIPPQTFEKGFTVEIEDTEGYVMEQSTDKAITIERNHIQPMASFTFVNPNDEDEPKPANNEIWYTATEKVEPYWDDANTYGVRLVTNTWDEATGKGVYTFAGDVTKVGAEAFLECNKLQSVTLPDSATEIGSNAFKNCDGLKEVTIGDGVTKIGTSAFFDCDAITKITFGHSLQTIGDQAFYSCYSLGNVVIGGNVATLGNRVFYECHNLKSVVIGDSVTSIGNNTFEKCYNLNSVIIGNGLTEISSYLFYGCSALRSITIPDSVISIKYNAFYGCSKLENITIGSSVEDIDVTAFQSCKAIKTFYGKYATTDGRALIKDDKVILYAKASGTEYTIPYGVTTIGSYAFHYASLVSVTIPESVTSIEDSAFYYSSDLKKVYCNALTPPSLSSSVFTQNASGRRIYVYDESVSAYKKKWSSYTDSIYGNGSYNGSEFTTIYYTTTDGNIVNSEYLSIKENTFTDGQGKMVICGKLNELPNNAFYNCDNLMSITIPDSVTIIGDSAFSSCSGLTDITIPDSVTIIGDSAFSSCSGLTDITIPDNVTIIGDSAFFECWNLTNITIPDSVTTIGDRAFYNCDLTSVTIPDSVTTIGDSAFYECNLTNVTIPDSVNHIGTQAFNCWGLKEFKGKYASEDSRALIKDETIIAYASASGDEYVVPENVTKIGAYAFANSNLQSITLHENINEIKEYAFDNWNLVRIYVMSAEPAYLNGYSFFNTGNYDLKIYVPKDSENRYKFDYYWDDYAAFIYPYDYERVQKNNEIWYTSVDNAIVEPNNRNAFGDANIVSNSYQDGRYIITFDRDITEIGYEAFWDCNDLSGITIPNSVTIIDGWSFSGCEYLQRVSMGDGVETIGEYAFHGCWELSAITLSNNLTKIEGHAFDGCNITSITIPDSVTELGQGAFAQCWYLSEFKGNFAKDNGKILVIDDSLVAFVNAGPSSYIIPNYVTSIGEGAFYDCNSLTSITIPDSVTSIGNSAFWSCSSLTSVTIGDSVTTIGDYAFQYCRSLTSVTIPDSVTEIGYEAFKYCTSLTEFTGKFAENNGRILVIDGCVVSFAPSGITEYTIPSTVTSIRDYTFYGCDNLISITIPSSVKSIGRQAFDYSDNLASIYCKAATPPTCSSSQFSGIASNFKIYVPVESVSAYKVATYWKNHVSAIVGYDFENGVIVE